MRIDEFGETRGHCGAPRGNRRPRRGSAAGTGALLKVLAATAILASLPRTSLAQSGPGGDLPPAGYGTLRQDDIAVRIATPNLQIQVLPLDERVIRLLTNDSYAALHGIRELKASQIDSAAARYGVTRPSLFIVTFFGLQPRAQFVPDDLTITSRNQFFRPIAIVPISPQWAEQQLQQRQTATAVYVFSDGIAVLEPFTVSYEGASSNTWSKVLRTLDAERAAVLSRATADTSR